MSEIILHMKNIEKHFHGVHALKGMELELEKGEIHALVGENGAGKSTLMKVLTGIYARDDGDILFEGAPVYFSRIKDAQDAGLIIVHQELNMCNHLTVAQNVFIGREPLTRAGLIDEKKMNEDTAALFEKLNIIIDPTEKMGNLTVGKQQIAEIAKAISFNAKIIVFDEPSAALTETEIAVLFKIIANLKEQGVTMVYISHRMNEITEISDRVTVMRDGEFAGRLITKETTIQDIISKMVGRVIYEQPKEKSAVAEDAPIVLEVENLNAGKMVQNVSFNLRKGEILGFAGLMGAGRTETARALFGADPKAGGTVRINGKLVSIKTPKDAIEAGIGYLSEDRKRFGVAIDMTIADNSAMAAFDNFTKTGIINDKSVLNIANKYVEALKTKTPNASQIVKKLSGGNQQKVVIAKWLIKDSQILIFDEPTRGIDVGAKSEIYKLMTDLAAAGKSIIMISSELAEVTRLSDRILVMCEGKKTGELPIEGVTQEAIMSLATKRD